MSAVEALESARAVGVHVEIQGDELLLEATSVPPTAVLEAISRHKTEIIALLRPSRDGWSAADWQGFFDERAGIAEFDGGLSRREAEVQAFACCVVEWLNRNPERSQPGCCLACGGREKGHDALLPFGIEPAGHVWLHGHCWAAWYAERKAKAASALRVMGIVTPVVCPTTKRLSSIDVSGQSWQKTYLPACGK